VERVEGRDEEGRPVGLEVRAHPPGEAKTAAGGAPYADDFADTLLLYARVKGTPEEARMRALFPERFRILDTM
jgi:hypothetical protein